MFLADADNAIYQAKNNGENRNVFYPEKNSHELADGLI